MRNSPAAAQRPGGRNADEEPAENGAHAIVLYYVRARWYDPSRGRFMSEDPIGLAGGINNYAYAANDPVNLSDPSGLGPCDLTWGGFTGGLTIGSQAGGCDNGFYDHRNWSYNPNDYATEGFAHHQMFGTDDMALRPCGGNGFSPTQCALVNEAANRLVEHPLPICQAMGRNARERLDRWQYSYDPHFPKFGYMRHGQPGVTLGPISFHPVSAGSRHLEVQNTVAHEEGHHIGLFHTGIELECRCNCLRSPLRRRSDMHAERGRVSSDEEALFASVV